MAGTLTTEGLNEILDDGLKDNDTVYLALVDNAGFSAYAEGDTAAQNGGTNGWTENTDYSEGTRPAWGPDAASGAAIGNSTTVDFSMNATVTILGSFAIDNSTKGGTGGNLFGAGDFSGGSASLVNGNTLKVTFQLTLTDNT